jgi:tetratricopeptide (TPR) repeat protein
LTDDLVKRLAGVCGRLPLLLIHLVRSERSSSLKLAGREPVDSETRQADLVSRHIDLGSLSDEDCHRMLTDVDLPAPEMPERLRGRWREFVVEHCAGSPLKAENLIGILVGSDLGESDDHKVPGELQSSHQLRVSTTLWGLLQARLDTLLKVERIALQRAAVMGNAFWPDALRHIALRDGENPSVDEIVTVLRSLERKGLIRRQGFSRFANSTEYVFESAVMQAVSYESILPRIHPGYHRQAAGWLARNSRRLPAGRNALIADHYEKAEDPIFAAELYEMAATRAQETYDLSLAIDHTCKALSILIDEHQHTSWQLGLQVALGDMLHRQARLVEAAQTYLTMEYIAQEDGDLTAQARALNGSALVQRDQAAYKLMLQSAEQAVPIARLAGDDEELVTALLLKSEAHFLMGDSSSAVRNVMRALERSRMSRNEEQFTVSLSRLFRIHERLGESKEARRFLRLLQQQVRHLNTVAFYDGQSFQQEEEPTKEIAALGKVCLGKAYQTLGLYDKADAQFEAALDIYRSTNANSGVASTLALLGETAQLAADVPKATSLFRQALAIAAMIGDERGALRYRTGLGESLIREGSFQAAVDALERVIQSAEDDARMSNWEGLPRAYCHLAQAQAGLMHSSTALDAALYGLELAVQSKTALQHARAWRILGEVAAMPGQRDPISVADTAYDAVDCFSESLHILRRSENRSVDVYRARLATLLAWSEYEQNRGNQEKAEALRNESSTIEQALFDWTNALVA